MNPELGTSSPELRPPNSPTKPDTDTVATNACQFALDSVSELMSLMIHDLANPLQSMTMQLELAGEAGQPGQGLDIDTLLDTSEEVGSLLNKISGFFYQRSSTAPCQLRASVARNQETMEHRLAKRGIAWESIWLEIPELPHNCIILELVLLRCLIMIGYQARFGQRQALTLRTALVLLRPYQAQAPVDLRIQLELLDQDKRPHQIFIPEKANAMQTQMERLGPGFRCSILANERVQLDFRLPCPTSR